MPAIDVVDSTWFAVPPAVLAPIVAEPTSWRGWWPDLRLRPDELRGEKGVRWTVEAIAGEAGLTGSAEIWLQPVFDGTVAHVFLRLDPLPGRALTPRAAAAVVDRFRRRTKQQLWQLADRLDPGRAARHTSAPHACVT